jgi:hypothetical protein
VVWHGEAGAQLGIAARGRTHARGSWLPRAAAWPCHARGSGIPGPRHDAAAEGATAARWAPAQKVARRSDERKGVLRPG